MNDHERRSNMSLSSDIADFKAQMAEQVPPETLEIMAEETNRLVASGIAEKSLQAGDKAPQFSLPNSRGETLSSEDLLAKGPVVLVFYRGGW
jgi:hypothetical protein